MYFLAGNFRLLRKLLGNVKIRRSLRLKKDIITDDLKEFR